MAAIGEEEQFQKLCHFVSTYFFLFGNIMAVKSISGIMCGNVMWFSTVHCHWCCSSLSCDNNNDKLRCMKLFKRLLQEGTLCHCACHNKLYNTKNPLTIQYIIKGKS